MNQGHVAVDSTVPSHSNAAAGVPGGVWDRLPDMSHRDADPDLVSVLELLDAALLEARQGPVGHGEVAGTALQRTVSLLLDADPVTWPGVPAAQAALFDAVLSNAEEPWRGWVTDVLVRNGRSVEAIFVKASASVASGHMAHFHADPDVYRWVAVPDLPYAHSPRVARHTFDRALRRSQHIESIERLLGVADPDRTRRRAGRWWQQRLTAADLGSHPPLADALEFVREGLTVAPFNAHAVERYIRNEVPPQVQRTVRGLLFDPITWSESSPIVSNGQHRIAQARLDGIASLPVVAN